MYLYVYKETENKCTNNLKYLYIKVTSPTKSAKIHVKGPSGICGEAAAFNIILATKAPRNTPANYEAQ